MENTNGIALTKQNRYFYCKNTYNERWFKYFFINIRSFVRAVRAGFAVKFPPRYFFPEYIENSSSF